MYKIVKKETLNNLVELMEIHAPFVARKCEPGQFIIIRVDEKGERVPLTIADYDERKGNSHNHLSGCRIFHKLFRKRKRETM